MTRKKELSILKRCGNVAIAVAWSRRSTGRSSIAVAGALAVGVAIGALCTPLQEVVAREKAASDIFDELKTYTDVLAIVQRDYVEEVQPKKVVEGSIKGMLTTLDPHSGYLDPDFYQDLQAQTKGEFGGLGIEITVKDGLLVVVAPMEGSPAERAGLKAGDAIVKIEGEFAKDFSLFDAVKRLRGPKGSKVKISVMRAYKPELIDISIVRDNIVVKSVKARYLGNGIGYVRISQFVEKTFDDLAKGLTMVKAEARGDKADTKGLGLRGLVIDVRNNPGGLLAQAVKVSDLFLNEGVIVYTDGRRKNEKQEYVATPTGTEPNYPIVVLINGGSASASEIVAGAIKDHGRGLVLGTQSFGKGSVQTITALSNGGALTLTTALYYTKSGRSIQALGISPDLIVESETETTRASGEWESVESGSSQQSGTLKKDKEKRPRIPLRMRERDLPGAIRNPSVAPEQLLSPEVRPGEAKPDGRESLDSSAVEEAAKERIDIEKIPVIDWLSQDIQLSKAVEILKTFNIFEKPDAAPTMKEAHGA